MCACQKWTVRAVKNLAQESTHTHNWWWVLQREEEDDICSPFFFGKVNTRTHIKEAILALQLLVLTKQTLVYIVHA